MLESIDWICDGEMEARLRPGYCWSLCVNRAERAQLFSSLQSAGSSRRRLRNTDFQAFFRPQPPGSTVFTFPHKTRPNLTDMGIPLILQSLVASISCIDQYHQKPYPFETPTLWADIPWASQLSCPIAFCVHESRRFGQVDESDARALPLCISSNN
jgi:hypothetical protein